MAKTLSEQQVAKVAAAEIEHFGEKVVLPEGMTLTQARELIDRRMEYEKQTTDIVEAFECYPFDGAVALDTVLNRRYGWSPAIATPGFFSENPPKLISVEVGYGEVRQVPWGRFLLPNVDGFLQTHAHGVERRWAFMLQAQIKRRDEKTIRELFAELRREIKANSIYRGKAIRINFFDNDGDVVANPQPKFLDTDSVDESKLVLSNDLHTAVNTSLFTPITRTRDCLDNGIPVKRGVLLGGTYGTGKTLIAHVASKYAAQSGITFLYIQKAVELAHAIEFARQYQSPACVIFCEDIDREVTGERTEEMDAVLNTIDGIDSKTSNIIVVLTTNNIRAINPAMLRPGRLDAVIDVTPPDAEAITRLVKVYAGAALETDADLTEVGKVLAGNIPAVIAEVVKRAKLSQLALQEPGTKVTKLGAAALLQAAKTIQAQVLLLNPPPAEQDNRLGEVFKDAVRDALNGNIEKIGRTAKQVDELHRHVVG